ncbi:single-stranded DNA-binding protein [Oscillospiraceae bacterium CM]|nr:single-stranded DNA-binding protein [Oscillospiraceae bacterium CM]
MNNVVQLCGSVGDRPKFSHQGGSDNYFSFPLEVERLSGYVDTINVIVRQDLLETLEVDGGSHLAVFGELRSFNNKRGDGSRLVISVLAKELTFTDDEDTNTVALTGVLCKRPNLRKTPMGRQICDLMLAVNRRYGRSDYLPCIAWGRLAEKTADLKVGAPLTLEGRIQSRTYIKTENNIQNERTAFEVSIVTIVP